jgi:hypothetical protein
MVELIGAQLPVDAAGDPHRVIEEIVDLVGIRITAPRAAHHREGHVKFTVDAVLVEEHDILEMVDERNNRSRLDVRRADVDALSVDQARAVCAISESPWLLQPLSAPAGAGKTHSLRAAAARASKDVLVLAPTGKAVDEALKEGAGDRGYTIAKALHYLERQASLALRSAHANHLRKAIGWYRTHDRLRIGDSVAMASDALDGYLSDCVKGKDSLLICDTWEMADALNRRLHDTLTQGGPVARAARDQEVRVGDLIVSRRNDATIAVQPGTGSRGGEGWIRSATATAGASPLSTPTPIGLPPNASPTTPAASSKRNT